MAATQSRMASQPKILEPSRLLPALTTASQPAPPWDIRWFLAHLRARTRSSVLAVHRLAIPHIECILSCYPPRETAPMFAILPAEPEGIATQLRHDAAGRLTTIPSTSTRSFKAATRPRSPATRAPAHRYYTNAMISTAAILDRHTVCPSECTP